MARRLRAPARDAASEHLLQLYETEESLASLVASFLADGAGRKEPLLVISTPAHRAAIWAALGRTEYDPAALTARGRLAAVSAERLLSRIMRHAQPDRGLFFEVMAPLVRRLGRRRGGRVRVYGEMVEILARDRNYSGALQLEQLWNDFAAANPISLLCAYPAARFAAPDAGSALTAICAEHACAMWDGSDSLGHFLLSTEKRNRQ
jgi:hypothetical protein